MSDLLNLLNSDRAVGKIITDSRKPDTLFQDARWDQVGTDKELTDFLHKSLDPNGSKFGGDTEKLKTEVLNEVTARGSSAIASIWDAIGARSESLQKKQFENLVGRLYEDAPNRLTSGDGSQAYEAVKSGLKGALVDDLLLNLAFGAGTLSRLGWVGGKAAIEGAGSAIARSGAYDALQAGMRGADAAAISGLADDAAGAVVRGTMIEGAKQGAKSEAISGAATSFLGDIAQQDAAVQRGLQDEISVAGTAANTIAGAALGGAFGAAGGAFEGRSVGRELLDKQPILKQANDGYNAIGRDAELQGMVTNPTPEKSADPAYVQFNSEVANARGDLEEYLRHVTAGDYKSEYTVPQLNAMYSAMVRLSNSGDVAEQYLRRAADLRASGDQAAANVFEAKADTFARFKQHMLDNEFGANELFADGMDIDKSFVSLLKGFDDEVAESFAPQATPKSGKAAAGATTNTSAAPMPTAADITGTPDTQAASIPGSTADPAATADLQAAKIVANPDAPTAAEIESLASTRFTPDEQASFTELNGLLQKSGIDLQQALDILSSAGGSKSDLVAKVAKAAGVSRSAVDVPLTKVTAATQREVSKASAAPETAPATQAATTNAAAPAAPEQTTVADDAAEVVERLEEVVAQADESLAVGDATIQFMQTKLDFKLQHEELGKVLEEAIQVVAGGQDKSSKVADIVKALDKAREQNPAIAPLIDALDPQKLTTKAGIDRQMTKLIQMADDAIAFGYHKVIGDVLPDPMNASHFDSVLKSVLRGAPAEEVEKISASYRKLVNNALIERAQAVGVENIQKDPKLGPAWQRMVEGLDGFQPFGGKTSVSVDVGAIVNRNAEYLQAALKSTGFNTADASSILVDAGKVVRDFMKQLQNSGIPMDSRFMQEALEHRAARAVHDAIEGTFRKENAEAFDKIEKMRELRQRDAGAKMFSRSSDNLRNPFYGSMVDNPVLHRVANVDAAGDTFYTEMIVSGRAQPRGDGGVRGVGRPQGIMSDGISDYLGLLWNSPKRMFAAASAARHAIYGAAVDMASWSRGTMMINGVKFSGSMKELKGLVKETINQRREASRMGLIMDAAERRRLPDSDPRYLSADAYNAYIEKIGSIERKVTDDELYVAELYLDHRERIKANTATAQAQMSEVLANAAELGESAADQIRSIVGRLNEFKARNDGNLLNALNSGKTKPTAQKGSSKTGLNQKSISVSDDGKVTPGSRDSDPVVLNIDGKKVEFVPEHHISMSQDGSVMLFGDKIGTWSKSDSGNGTVKLNVKGFEGEEIKDLTAMSRKALVKNFPEKFKANMEKLVPAKAADDVGEGTQIDKSLSQTQAANDAQRELLNPAAVKADDMDRKIGSFDVPEGRSLVIKRTIDGRSRIIKPGQTRAGMSMREFLSTMKLQANDVEIGTIPAGRMSKAGEIAGVTRQQYMLPRFVPLGRDTGTADPMLLKKLAEKKEAAPLLLKAQRQPISFKEASKITTPGGKTLDEIVDEYDAAVLSLDWSKVRDIAQFDSLVEDLKKQADVIESIAPHGLKRKNASRRTSFFYLQQAMAKFSLDEQTRALDFLRQINYTRGGLPYFYAKGGNGNQFSAGFGADAGKSRITIGGVADATPKHVAVIHETGHWAFMNMLSPSEKLQFISSLSKYYDADGKLDMDAVFSAMGNAAEVERLTGKKLADVRNNTNELFAWQFTSYALKKMNGEAIDQAEETLWSRIVAYGKALLEKFLGQKVDPDLLPLFEKIMPSTLSEQKFLYDALRDRSTGEIVQAGAIQQADRVKVNAVTGVMQKIDTMRSRIAAQLFTPGGIDVGFVEELKSAASHMFGLLYGKEANVTVAGLRAKLNPLRNEGDWLRDSKGKVVKDAQVRGVRAPIKLDGSIDPRELFSRSSTGKLMQAIRDVMPEGGAADNVAFEAAASAEEFAVHIKSSAIGDNPEVQAVFNQSLEQQFKKNIDAGMKESDALDSAEEFAYKEASSYAKDEFDIDVTSSLFDNGVRVKLGTDEQAQVFGDVARKLHDLMGDALDHLDTEVSRFGFTLQRNKAEVSVAPKSAAEIASDARVNKSVGKVDVPPAKVEPMNEKSAAVVAREESERFDGNANGVPTGAPSLVKSLISRVPHRDADQNDIIGSMMYRVFSHIMGDDLDNISNADIARLSGVDLEDGLKPEGMASSTSEAFNALRKGFRLASEELTNANKKPEGAIDFVASLLSRNELKNVNEEFGSNLSADQLAGMVKRVMSGKKLDNDVAEMFDYVSEIAGSTIDILGGLAKTARAKSVVGDAVATPGLPVVAKSADGLNPRFARAAVEARIAALPAEVVDDLLSSVGVPKGTSIANHIGFVSGTGRRVFTTVDEMMSIAHADESVSRIDAEIGKALSDKDEASVIRLMAKRDALVRELGLGSDSVTPVLVNTEKIFDPMSLSVAAKAAVDMAMSSGNFKNLDDALKSLGYNGKLEGEVAKMFKPSAVHKLEDKIAEVLAARTTPLAPDAPLTGEIALNMTLVDGVKPDPLAVEQRSLVAGATEGAAKVMSKLFKKNRSASGLTDQEMIEVRTFSGVQIRSNASRIFKAGGEWLGNLVAPVEGTSFQDALATKTSESLVPLINKIDKASGNTNWAKKTLSQIYRNVNMWDHKIPQTDVEERIAMSMRNKDISALSMEERVVRADLAKHFRDLLVAQRDAGIPVGDITAAGATDAYLPQRFNVQWIAANRDEAVKRLGEWFRKDRGQGADAADAMRDARRVINDAIFREEFNGILDGANSTYAQAFGDKLHTRKLNIAGKDWEQMAPLFDNNLRSLLITYTDVANKRIEWTKRFGVKGHAANTYLDIANRGHKAAVDALTSKADGMKTVIGGSSRGEELLPATDVGEVEAVSTLFSPMLRDRDEATQMVALISKMLRDQGKDPGSRSGIVEMLTKRFSDDGGFGVEHFRKRAEAVVNGLADFGDLGGTVSDGEINFMMRMVGVLGGRPSHTITSNNGMKEMAGAVKAFNSVSLLSGTVLSSLPDAVMSMVRSGSGSAWLKGTAQAVKLAMNDQAFSDAMARVGVGLEAILNENITHANGRISGRITNAFFLTTMLTQWTDVQRKTSALVGFESIKANQIIAQRERYAGTTDTWAYRKSMRYLRQLGLAELVDAKPLNDFASAVNGDSKIAEAIHKFTNESVFQPNRNDVPLWAQDPIAGILWQFKSYPVMMGRLVKRSFKEAIATENGKYAGDPAGLMYLLTIGAAAGAGTMAVKDVALGRNEENDGDERTVRDRRLSKILKEFGIEDVAVGSQEADAFFGHYLEGLLGIGALGFLGDMMYQSAKSLDNGSFGRERIMSQIFGPTLGTFSDAIQVVEGVQDAMQDEAGFGSGSAKQRNAVRKVVKRIPVLGNQSPWVETFVDDTAGEAQVERTQQ